MISFTLHFPETSSPGFIRSKSSIRQRLASGSSIPTVVSKSSEQLMGNPGNAGRINPFIYDILI